MKIRVGTLRKYLVEILRENSDQTFIRHLQNGLGYARGNQNLQAAQIASDWLEEMELNSGVLLAPGHVFRIEKFVTSQWPAVLEQFHGNKTMALIVINNILNANFNSLR